MKVVILAGGYGTRLSEYTDTIPKPMVTIAGKPILWHIMNIYSKFGFSDFYIALGYKGNLIKEYFLNYKSINSDFRVDLSSGNISILNSNNDSNWNVTLIDTGEKTMTGGRVKKICKDFKDESFFLTYGDGLANIDLNELLSFHKKQKKLITLTSVRPNARFGELLIDDGIVTSFQEKPQLQEGWINGGFFVVEPKFLDYIDSDDTVLEREPLEKAVKERQLAAYSHDGFWQCMDSRRDRELLEELASQNYSPW